MKDGENVVGTLRESSLWARVKASKVFGIVVNASRLLMALTFIFSGYVKAIDPLGTQYKIHDYLIALHLQDYIPAWVELAGSISLT